MVSASCDWSTENGVIENGNRKWLAVLWLVFRIQAGFWLADAIAYIYRWREFSGSVYQQPEYREVMDTEAWDLPSLIITGLDTKWLPHHMATTPHGNNNSYVHFAVLYFTFIFDIGKAWHMGDSLLNVICNVGHLYHNGTINTIYNSLE